MIWWLVAGALGVLGIANAILNRLKNTAAKERQRWNNEYKAVERKIKQYDYEIQQKVHAAQNTVDFHLLTNLHFESLKVADHAYSLLQDSRVSLDAIGQAIVETAKEKNKLISQKRNTWNPFKASEIEQEIAALVDLNRQLYSDKDQLKAQRDHFYAQVKNFNARTHGLKLAIRDRCGVQGREWYKRLEDRTVVKRENRERAKKGLPALPLPNQQPKLSQPKVRVKGTVKWFDLNKGYGFVSPDDRKADVHVHKSNLSGVASLRENDRVEFERVQGSKGPWANNVRKI